MPPRRLVVMHMICVLVSVLGMVTLREAIWIIVRRGGVYRDLWVPVVLVLLTLSIVVGPLLWVFATLRSARWLRVISLSLAIVYVSSAVWLFPFGGWEDLGVVVVFAGGLCWFGVWDVRVQRWMAGRRAGVGDSR